MVRSYLQKIVCRQERILLPSSKVNCINDSIRLQVPAPSDLVVANDWQCSVHNKPRLHNDAVRWKQTCHARHVPLTPHHEHHTWPVGSAGTVPTASESVHPPL